MRPRRRRLRRAAPGGTARPDQPAPTLRPWLIGDVGPTVGLYLTAG